jgi:DNA excision repair protein ERCC-4
MTTWISPTEPRALRALGTTSLLPERFGCDVLFTSPNHGFVGIQRKELADFLASVQDGRLSKELSQMNNVGLPCLIMETTPRWTLDGYLFDNYKNWTRSQHRNLLLSIQDKGVRVMHTADLAETIEAVADLRAWAAKSRHDSLSRRPKARGSWGKAGHKDFACHLLQSFDGIGPEQARRLVEHFGGAPLNWTVTEKDLLAVPGMGKTKVRRLMAALGGLGGDVDERRAG